MPTLLDKIRANAAAAKETYTLEEIEKSFQVSVRAPGHLTAAGQEEWMEEEWRVFRANLVVRRLSTKGKN